MRKRFLIALVALLSLVAADAWAGVTINREGAGGEAQISVTSAAAVKIFRGDGTRYRRSFISTQPLHCSWGSADDTAPATTPTSSVGFPIAAGILYTDDLIPGAPTEASTRVRLDCIADSTTATVSTFEEN